MDIIDKIGNFIKKLQELPDKKKKIVLWASVAILGLIMGYFWLVGTIDNLGKIGKSLNGIKLPEIQMPSTDLGQVTSPTNGAGVIQAPASSTSSWQVYSNDEYGVSFEYPNSFNENQESGDLKTGLLTVAFSEEKRYPFWFYLGSNTDAQVIDKISGNSKDVWSFQKNKTTINGLDWTATNEVDGGQNGQGTTSFISSYYISRGDKYYILQCLDCGDFSANPDSSSAENNKILNQMVSTFKFTK